MRVNMEDGRDRKGRVMAVYLDDGSRLGEVSAQDPDPEPGRYALEEMLGAIATEAAQDAEEYCTNCPCMWCEKQRR